MKRILFILLFLPVLVQAQNRNTPQRLYYPATDTIRLITVTNVFGEAVFNRFYNHERISVNIKGYPSGFYFISINGSAPWNYFCSDYIHFNVVREPQGAKGIL